jgi:hypothetical protein
MFLSCVVTSVAKNEPFSQRPIVQILCRILQRGHPQPSRTLRLGLNCITIEFYVQYEVKPYVVLYGYTSTKYYLLCLQYVCVHPWVPVSTGTCSTEQQIMRVPQYDRLSIVTTQFYWYVVTCTTHCTKIA